MVLIDMEMPKRCEECAFMSDVNTVYQIACGCKLTMKIREIDNDMRPDWCPLKPFTPAKKKEEEE